MKPILSQKEVDLLLKGFSEVELPKSSSKRTSYHIEEVVPYDLAHQNRVIRGRMPALEMIHSRFARLFRQTLTTHLRRSINIQPRATELVNYKDFIQGVSYPSSLNLFHLSPLRGTAVLVLERRLVYTFIDMLFGGTGELEVQTVKRDFSPIETRMISKVVHSALEDLQSAWKPYIPLRVRYRRSENNPQFVAMTTETEIVVVTTFDVEIHHSPMTLSIGIPYSMLDPIRSKLNSGYQSDQLDTNSVSAKLLAQNLRQTSVSVKVFLGHAKLSLRRFLNLNVGDHIVLEQDSRQPLEVMVQNTPKFLGAQGSFKGHRAIKIEKLIYQPQLFRDLFENSSEPPSDAKRNNVLPSERITGKEGSRS